MRVLLISPVFHGYWRSYSNALEQLGHTVETCIYQAFESLGAKLRNKLVYELPERFGSSRGEAAFSRHVTEAALAKLDAAKPEALLVIKGDVLEERFWDEVNRRRTPSVLYLYDDLANMRHTKATLAGPRALATFSPADRGRLASRGYEAQLVPMGFDPKVQYSPVRQEAIVFAGARYSDREEALVGLHEHGLPVIAYGREWSHHPLDRFRSWSLERPNVSGRRDISFSEWLGVASGAAAAYNAHGGHDGVNPRTFEICGVGGLQLVDRDDVARFYEPGREVLVFHSQDELRALAERALEDRAWAEPIREAARRRTLAEHTILHRTRELTALW